MVETMSPRQLTQTFDNASQRCFELREVDIQDWARGDSNFVTLRIDT